MSTKQTPREFSKVDRALEVAVIDWLQWTDFNDIDHTKYNEPDHGTKAQLALELISKRKEYTQALESKLKEAIELLERSKSCAFTHSMQTYSNISQNLGTEIEEFLARDTLSKLKSEGKMSNLKTLIEKLRELDKKRKSNRMLYNEFLIAEKVPNLLKIIEIMSEALNKVNEDFGTDWCDGNVMIANKAIIQVEDLLKDDE